MKIDLDKQYRTRDGLPVRLLSDNGSKSHPVVGFVRHSDNEYLCQWTLEGHRNPSGAHSSWDLVPAPEKRKVAVWLDRKGEPFAVSDPLHCLVPAYATIIELEIPQ